MPARRIAIFAGVILLLGLASAMIAPPRDRAPDLTPQGTPATTQTADETPAEMPAEAGVVTASLSPDTTEREGRIRARVGDLVRIEVSSDRLDTVALGELRTRAVEPGAPARLKLTAAAPGRYPITLQGARTQLGTLEVK